MYEPKNAKKFNQFAREQMKLKILADVNMDMEICKLEGWDVMQYLVELGDMLQEIISKEKSHE